VSGVLASAVGCAVESTLELVGEDGSADEEDSCGNLTRISLDNDRVIIFVFDAVLDAFVGGAIAYSIVRVFQGGRMKGDVFDVLVMG
jgi:hypothetical protein